MLRLCPWQWLQVVSTLLYFTPVILGAFVFRSSLDFLFRTSARFHILL